jgi:hypothetical protein
MPARCAGAPRSSVSKRKEKYNVLKSDHLRVLVRIR